MPELTPHEFQIWIARAIADLRQAIDINPRPGFPDWRWAAQMGPLPDPWRAPDLTSLSKPQLELAREKIKLEKQWLDALERHLDERIEQTAPPTA